MTGFEFPNALYNPNHFKQTGIGDVNKKTECSVFEELCTNHPWLDKAKKEEVSFYKLRIPLIPNIGKIEPKSCNQMKQ